MTNPPLDPSANEAIRTAARRAADAAREQQRAATNPAEAEHGSWLTRPGPVPVPWRAEEIAAAVREGTLTATDAVTESLARIEAHDSELGAFQQVRAAAALAEAAEFDADPARSSLPLAGVPISIKDNVAVAGEPMRDGSAASPDAPQAADHPVVEALRAAGAIVVGTTRVPELCLFSETDSTFGITRNPWNPSLTSGGSSGGAATSVAAAMVPLAHGNDGLGSVRIPAACTGLVGIKPGRGVVPAQLGAHDWFGMSENGLLGVSVTDVALGLSALAGRPIEASDELPPLKIAVSTKSPLVGPGPDAAFVRAVNSTATVLARHGHEVEQADPGYPQRAAIQAIARWFAAAADDADDLAAHGGDLRRLERRTKTHAALGRLTRKLPVVSDGFTARFREQSEQFLTEHDVLITPALAQPPIAAKTWSRESWLATMLGTVNWTPFAAPWNIAGFPAMVVPTGTLHPAARTPMAVQLVARPGQEALLLSVARQIHALRPWPAHPPAYT